MDVENEMKIPEIPSYKMHTHPTATKKIQSASCRSKKYYHLIIIFPEASVQLCTFNIIRVDRNCLLSTKEKSPFNLTNPFFINDRLARVSSKQTGCKSSFPCLFRTSDIPISCAALILSLIFHFLTWLPKCW